MADTKILIWAGRRCLWPLEQYSMADLRLLCDLLIVLERQIHTFLSGETTILSCHSAFMQFS